jgi:hypothetical protein
VAIDVRGSLSPAPPQSDLTHAAAVAMSLILQLEIGGPDIGRDHGEEGGG